VSGEALLFLEYPDGAV